MAAVAILVIGGRLGKVTRRSVDGGSIVAEVCCSSMKARPRPRA
jgi:hypothetical protein